MLGADPDPAAPVSLAPSPESVPVSPVPAPENTFCICDIVSSNLFLNSSSSIASNSLAVSPNEAPSEIVDTNVNSKS